MNYINEVKAALGITGSYQDDTIQEYIDEVKSYLIDSGVLESDITPGLVSRGVADLWNYGAGDRKFSTYFIERTIQLSYKRGEINE